MTREQAIDKIKKLKALKDSAEKIGSEGEAKNATTIINKLMNQFGISWNDIFADYGSEQPEDNSQKPNDKSEDPKSKAKKARHSKAYANAKPRYNEARQRKFMRKLHKKLSEQFQNYIERTEGIEDADERYKYVMGNFDNYETYMLDNSYIVGMCYDYGISYDRYRSLIEEEKERAIEQLLRECAWQKEAQEVYEKEQKEQKIWNKFHVHFHTRKSQYSETNQEDQKPEETKKESAGSWAGTIAFFIILALFLCIKNAPSSRSYDNSATQHHAQSELAKKLSKQLKDEFYHYNNGTATPEESIQVEKLKEASRAFEESNAREDNE